MTPFKGTNRITSPFGPRRSPISGRQEQHKGEDIVTSGTWPGDAWLVRECTGGTVLRVTKDQWRGNYVDVETWPGVFERYQHMHEIYVRPGRAVPQGFILGMAGKTGDSTGVHLHFEVQKSGGAVNPSAWSGVPNAVGSYAGDDKMDGAADVPVPGAGEPGAVKPERPTAPEPAKPQPEWPEVPSGPVGPAGPGRPVLYEYSGIVASPGDAAAIEGLLAGLGIPFDKKEAG